MRKLFTLVFFIFVSMNSYAQILAWNVFGQTSYGTQGLAPNVFDANVTAIGLTRGSGLTTTGSAGGNLWGANGFAFTTASNAIDSSKFFTFGFTTNTNYRTSLSHIDTLRIRVSSSGPINVLVQYAINTGSFNDLEVFSYTRPGGTTNVVLDSIGLTNIAALQNISAGTTVTFRIVPYGATNTSGTFYVGNQASVNHLSVVGSVLLPVTLKSLKASLINNAVDLNWATSNETNFDYFGVEKSFDAKNFSPIAKVASNKTNNGSNYAFTDFGKTLAQQYYRLKMVDNDGSFKYSQVVAVNGKASTSLEVFPNPVVNTVIMSHPKAAAGATIRIVSIDGRSISVTPVQTGATQTSIDVTRFVKSNYIASFEDKNEKSTVRFTKQ